MPDVQTNRVPRQGDHRRKRRLVMDMKNVQVWRIGYAWWMLGLSESSKLDFWHCQISPSSTPYYSPLLHYYFHRQVNPTSDAQIT